MARSFLHLALSMVLASSVLLPSVYELMHSDTEVIALLDAPAEEKDSLAEIDVDEKIVQDLATPTSELHLLPKKNLNKPYRESYSIHASDILLPPPESQV